MLSTFGYREYDIISNEEAAELDVDHVLRLGEKR